MYSANCNIYQIWYNKTIKGPQNKGDKHHEKVRNRDHPPQRNPREFLAYVRAQLKKKNMRDLSSDLELDYFRRGCDLNFSYRNDPEKPCKAEKSVSRPYEMQTYILNWDGTMYNEICEFDFDNDKTGSGYYYLVNTI